MQNVPQNRDVNTSQRVQLAMEMRAAKAKWDDIARPCGYGNPDTAHRAVMRELERAISVDVEELRREELDSLEQVERECWKRLSHGMRNEIS